MSDQPDNLLAIRLRLINMEGAIRQQIIDLEAAINPKVGPLRIEVDSLTQRMLSLEGRVAALQARRP